MQDFTPNAMGWLKKQFIVLTLVFLSVTFPVFLVSGYTALYWAWVRGNLSAALPYLPWARGFGTLAVIGAAAGLGILFSPRIFPISPRVRLSLSILCGITIAFFSEFRNEGKFYFKRLVHFFGPGTWAHDGLNRVWPSLGDFLYRFEYSHWNDFLMGPAIVSVLFSLVFFKIYRASEDQSQPSLEGQHLDSSSELDDVLRFARILMYIGLFWFFTQAWAEKAGYLRNPYSNDEVDLPFEFAGTMLGFWMARVLTKPFDQRSEKFRSTLLIDLVSSGLIGLLYTLIVGPLTEGIASTIAHALHPVVPASLNFHEYTPFQRHMRPFELLLLAVATWWALNWSSKEERFTHLSSSDEAMESESKWAGVTTMAKALAVIVGYLVIVATTLSILEPEGLGWTVAEAGIGIAIGTVVLLLMKRFGQEGFTSVFSTDHHGIAR